MNKSAKSKLENGLVCVEQATWQKAGTTLFHFQVLALLWRVQYKTPDIIIAEQ